MVNSQFGSRMGGGWEKGGNNASVAVFSFWVDEMDSVSVCECAGVCCSRKRAIRMTRVGHEPYFNLHRCTGALSLSLSLSVRAKKFHF